MKNISGDELLLSAGNQLTGSPTSPHNTDICHQSHRKLDNLNTSDGDPLMT